MGKKILKLNPNGIFRSEQVMGGSGEMIWAVTFGFDKGETIIAHPVDKEHADGLALDLNKTLMPSW